MSKSILTPVGRASFPSLSKMDQFGNYSLTVLIPKNDPKATTFVNWLKEAVYEEAKALVGEAGIQTAMSHFTAFKDGDQAAAFKTWRPEYEGHWVLTLKRKPDFGRPTVVDRDKRPIDASEVYAGADVIAFIDVYGYAYGTKKSVSISFQHVMKVGENTKFAGTGVEADQAFADVELPPEDKSAGIAPGGFGTPPAPQQPMPQQASPQPAPQQPQQAPPAPPAAPQPMQQTPPAQQPPVNPFGSV